MKITSNLSKGDVIEVTNQNNKRNIVVGGIVLLDLFASRLYIYCQRNKM